MAIAATNDTDVNISVYDVAEERAMLVNVVDVPSLCNFILPAIVRTGPLAVAISTAGASPALAKRMKREISELFGESYAELAGILNEERLWAKQTLPTYQDRKAFFEEIVNGEPDPIALLREDRRDELAAVIAAARERHGAAVARLGALRLAAGWGWPGPGGGGVTARSVRGVGVCVGTVAWEARLSVIWTDRRHMWSSRSRYGVDARE